MTDPQPTQPEVPPTPPAPAPPPTPTPGEPPMPSPTPPLYGENFVFEVLATDAAGNTAVDTWVVNVYIIF